MPKLQKALAEPAATLSRLIGAGPYATLQTSFPGYRARGYQALATERTVRVLEQGKDALLLLDPGLGKTLLSHLTFLSLRERSPRRWRTCLILVPSRLLRDQHAVAARWIGNRAFVVNLDDVATKSVGSLRRLCQNGSLIISTPKRLMNAVKRDFLLRQWLHKVSLCVADEFDAHAAEDITADGEPIGRLSEACRDLVIELRANNTPFLCMSATRRAAAASWEDLFELSEVTVPRQAIGGYTAFFSLHFVPVADKSTIEADQMLGLVVVDSLRKIRHHVTKEFVVDPELDRGLIYRQAAAILDGRRSALNFGGAPGMPGKIEVDARLRSFLGRLMRAYSERLFLYEGRLAKIELETYQRRAMIRAGEAILVSSVKGVQYETGAVETKKIQWLIDRLQGRNVKRTLVMVRNTDVNEYISQRLASVNQPHVRLWGEMSDRQRREAIGRFRAGSAGVAIVNRSMGGRGFDLPFADEAIFLSPKASHEVMWQESLRIRSTVQHTKDVFVLVYEQTEEEEKCKRLLDAIRNNPDSFRAAMPDCDEPV